MGERYERVRSLGGSAPTDTWLARDTQSGEEVVLKELRVSRVDRWKMLELFEREAQTLRQLDHPCIPAYVDAFHVEEEDDLLCCLVQEYVPGPTLHDLLREADGLSIFDEAEARAFALHMLELLRYLHGLNPPVTHRDIKPGNIIRATAEDGTTRWVLVDFGAVQAKLPQTMTGSTFVGTTGYMPPEQLMGRAVPASDLFALGATLIHAATGFHPGDLPVRKMRLEFESLIEFDDDFEAWMARLVAPTPAARWVSARHAQKALEQLPPPTSAGTTALQRVTPGDSASMFVKREGDQQIVTFKRVWRQPLATFGWLGFILLFIILIWAFVGKLVLWKAALVFSVGITSIPMLLYCMERHTLTLGPERFTFTRVGFFGDERARVEGLRRHLQLERVGILVRHANTNPANAYGLLLRHGVDELVLGANHTLDELKTIQRELGYDTPDEEEQQ